MEIQCIDEGNIVDRSIFYQSKLIATSLKEGQDYSDLPNIISIWIVAGSATGRTGCLHEIVYTYQKSSVDPSEVASNKTRHFIIELAKLEATPKRSINKMLAIWMQFIRNPNMIPPEFLEFGG